VCIFSLTVAILIESGVSRNRFSSWYVHGVRIVKISQPILWLSFPACCSAWVLWVQFSEGTISTFINHTHSCGCEIVWPTIFQGFRFNAGGNERTLSRMNRLTRLCRELSMRCSRSFRAPTWWLQLHSVIFLTGVVLRSSRERLVTSAPSSECWSPFSFLIGLTTEFLL